MPDESMVYHNSHSAEYRSPFGAVSCGTAVRLRLRVHPSARAQSIVARFWFDGRESRHAMVPSTLADLWTPDLFECSVPMPDEPVVAWYWFEIITPDGLLFYCNNSHQLGGVGQTSRHPLGSYQISVYDPSFVVPEWFKDSVLYQIFPDRFYRGHQRPNWCELAGAKGIYHTKWDDDPLSIPHPKGGIKSDDFFGGSLQGIIEKLPYLKTLGISAIYLNPIFLSPSNHRYDTSDYFAVDTLLGDESTFRSLCSEAMKLGIRIILDGVFSHTGSDSAYFNKESTFPSVGAYQSKDSPYYPWYKFRCHPDDYESWWGIDTLPNVDETNDSYQDFIAGTEGVVRHWLKLGASGWRLDVADELPDVFLEKIRSSVKSEKSDAIVIGEVWEDASNKVSYGQLRRFLSGRELDSPTNYPLRDIILRFLNSHIDSVEMAAHFMSLYENYPREALYSAMNLLSSHDVDRAATALGGRTGRQLDDDVVRRRFMLALLLQFTFPGVPCIYYGDEAGLLGGRDPLCRRPFPWGHEDGVLHEWHRRLISERYAKKVLRVGDWTPFTPHPSVYGHIRRVVGGDTAIAIVNREADAGVTLTITADELPTGRYFDAWTGKELSSGTDNIEVAMGPLEGRLLYSMANPG